MRQPIDVTEGNSVTPVQGTVHKGDWQDWNLSELAKCEDGRDHASGPKPPLLEVKAGGGSEGERMKERREGLGLKIWIIIK